MYGKSQTADRSQIKQHKREQLLTLLVAKFRNKYMVNSVEEMHIDKVIFEEVTELVSQGSTYEANLYSLDKKLERIIKDMRAGKEPNRSNLGSRKS